MTTLAYKAAFLSIVLMCSTTVMANKHKPAKSAYKHQDKARVIHVEPHYVYSSNGKRNGDCQSDNNHHRSSLPSYTTTIAGTLVGGLIGHQFGQGNGNTLATVTGAVLGGAAGYQYQHYDARQHQRNNYKQPCHTKRHQKQQGYDVTYRYHGQTHHTHLNYRPGKYIPINTKHHRTTRYY